MYARSPSLVAAALLLASGCAPRLIPGTDIERNDDTEAIIQVMEKYRRAMEGRDAEALMSVISPQFRDNGGTSTPDDDLDYRSLLEALKNRFEKIDEVHLQIDVRDIDVQRDDASAVYYYTLRWRMPRLTNTPHSSAELKRMEFKRAQGAWKIVSGI
jgi:hypothetical protein